MLIIERKEGENIERVLKRYKRKYRNVKLMREIRSRQEFKKRSTLKREILKKAQYREQFLNQSEDV
ncbi:MAG: 30S ribosomal protein S21 [Flavobacteriaceae bacterium]|nr:30S ribosomal protein S21 [Bacteroidia bacterium]MBT8288745.1 30S ribosomal protein S21 [Bacteroidia bacterium]NNF73684.1 30S ribosomal protein S21 [Flavobacteriaceae bacterium]NNK71758.1 30S ribosomal protein S21 [Flavobacteriaceae bacterium]